LNTGRESNLRGLARHVAAQRGSERAQQLGDVAVRRYGGGALSRSGMSGVECGAMLEEAFRTTIRKMTRRRGPYLIAEALTALMVCIVCASVSSRN
jgi:hypothetical protein